MRMTARYPTRRDRKRLRRRRRRRGRRRRRRRRRSRARDTLRLDPESDRSARVGTPLLLTPRKRRGASMSQVERGMRGRSDDGVVIRSRRWRRRAHATSAGRRRVRGGGDARSRVTGKTRRRRRRRRRQGETTSQMTSPTSPPLLDSSRRTQRRQWQLQRQWQQQQQQQHKRILRRHLRLRVQTSLGDDEWRRWRRQGVQRVRHGRGRAWAAARGEMWEPAFGPRLSHKSAESKPRSPSSSEGGGGVGEKKTVSSLSVPDAAGSGVIAATVARDAAVAHDMPPTPPTRL